jgi:predicted TIM-barrel fold metal-dependent hydrolase
MARARSLREHLLAEMHSIKTVDCHSHTMSKAEYQTSAPLDLFRIQSYFSREIEALVGPDPYAGAEDDGERWERLRAILDRARNTSYWRHNMVMYWRLFGLDDSELTNGNWHEVNDRIRETTSDPNWYDHITDEVCQLETQVRNMNWFEDWDPAHFTGVLRMEGAAMDLHHTEARERLAAFSGISIDGLAEHKQATRTALDRYVAKGAIGIKLGHAYGRTLYSEPVPEREAASIFERVLRGEDIDGAQVKALQDHMVFYLAELVQEMGLVFQIHTGVQTTWGNIPDSNPLHLMPLLKAFPRARFDLFHAGYPYSREMGMLGKHYPNVWLNMAWMYVISTAASRQTLLEWIDLVPGHRLLAFGSDVGFPEMIFPHLEMARECLADVLAEKVARDYMSEDEALRLAVNMLRENALDLYRLRR